MTSSGEGFGAERKGNAGVGALAAVVIACAIVGFALSWAYAPIQDYMPFIYASALLTYATGWFIGKVAVAVVKRKRIAMEKPAMIAGAVGGLIAWWFCWPAYIYTIAESDKLSFYFEALNPSSLLDFMRFVAHHPRWSLSKESNLPAVVFYLLWLIEAGFIIVLPAIACRDFIRSNRLCEKCGDWLKSTGDAAVFTIPEETAVEVLERIGSGDISRLPDLDRRPEEGDDKLHWLEARGFACSQCQDEDSYVSVYLISLEYNKKSKKYDRAEKLLTQFVPVDVEMEGRIFEPVPAAAGREPSSVDQPAVAETSGETAEQ